MLIQIRGCPIWNTNKTLAIAITALTAMIPDIHFKSNFSNTKAKGSPTFNSLYDTIPVKTKAITTYKIVQMMMAHIIPRGKSRCGSLHSSAVVEIASKPI